MDIGASTLSANILRRDKHGVERDPGLTEELPVEEFNTLGVYKTSFPMGGVGDASWVGSAYVSHEHGLPMVFLLLQALLPLSVSDS